MALLLLHADSALDSFLPRRLVFVLLAAVGLASSLWAPERAPSAAALRAPRARSAEPQAASRAGGSRERARPTATSRPSTAGKVYTNAGAVLREATVCLLREVESGTHSRCVNTDTNGTFELQDLKEPATSIVASAPGYLPSWRDLASRGDAESTPVSFHLVPGGSEVSGAVVDAAGGPVPFALVTSRARDGERRSAAVADEKGEFRVAVAPGEHELLARADAYSTALRRVRAPISRIVLELGPSSEIKGGVVSAATGEPLAGVSVHVAQATERTAGGELPGEPARTVTTDPDGNFSTGALRGGHLYELQVAGPEWVSEPLTVSLDVGASSPELLLAAHPASVLTGSVLSDGRPCSEGQVRVLASPRGDWSARIDADGLVHFPGLPPGRYAVEVDCAQALPFREELDLVRGRVERAWVVERGIELRGRVIDARGQPSRATVAVRPQGELSEVLGLRLCASDADGVFACAGLLPGEYEASVVDPLDPAAQVVSVVLDGHGAPDLQLHVGSFGSIRVAVKGLEEYGAGARVFARGPAAFPVEATREAEELAFRRLPLGRYEVYVDQPSAQGAAAVVELARDGQVIGIELELPTSAVISGFVVDEGGTPLVEGWVGSFASDPLARSGPSAEPEALTDERGAFTLPAVLGGVYDLRAESGLSSAELLGVVAGAKDVLLHAARRRFEPIASD